MGWGRLNNDRAAGRCLLLLACSVDDRQMAAFNESGSRGQASMNDGRYRPVDWLGQ